jgi:hypothetical protein
LGGPNHHLAIARFFSAAQRDFAGRLRWSVTPELDGANHPPEIEWRGSANIFAEPGDHIQLGGDIIDPDGDAVTVRWWQYTDVDTYRGRVAFADSSMPDTDVKLPRDARPGDTIHLILEATDSGVPALTRYKRVIITVRN